jgi:hypothetical protein
MHFTTDPVTPTPTATSTTTPTIDPTMKYNITSSGVSGGVAIPSGEWEAYGGEEVLISFDSKPGYILDAIQVNDEWWSPSAYIRLRVDKNYEIVAIGRQSDQTRADFTVVPG